MRSTIKQTKTPLTKDQRIENLEGRVGILEDQILNCLKFMRHFAEKEAEKLDPTFQPHKATAKA